MTSQELAIGEAAGAVAHARTMKALVYHGPGQRSWEDKAVPVIQDGGDAIVRITTATICGTDLHPEG